MMGAGIVEILIPEQKTNRDGRDENKTGSDHFLRQGGALRMGRTLENSFIAWIPFIDCFTELGNLPTLMVL